MIYRVTAVFKLKVFKIVKSNKLLLISVEMNVKNLNE